MVVDVLYLVVKWSRPCISVERRTVFNRRDGVVVRASASQSVDLGAIPLSSHTERL